MLRPVGYLLLAGVACFGLLVATNFYGDRLAGDVYAHVAKGQSEVSILKVLGRPDAEMPCGQFLWWDGDTANPEPNRGQCVRWVRYSYFSSAWAFGYSHDGKLVSRYHYVSE